MIPVKNLTESVKSRLHSIAIARHEDFNLTLIRYGVERLLYRLSKSDYKDQFLLKGAMLFMLWDALPHRPTKDLDLLGFVPAEKKILVGIFREIVGAEVEPDGLAFDRENIIPTEILENNRYGGTRIKLIAWLGNARIPIQIDIGSGDVVTPAPEPVVFPVMLEFPAPQIRAYPVYTVMAEKIEAAAKLKETNSRMKDFYDIWFLLQRFSFDAAILRTAISATFERRKTALPEFPEPFSETLAGDPKKHQQWEAFLRRNSLTDTTADFHDLVVDIRSFLGKALQESYSH